MKEKVYFAHRVENWKYVSHKYLDLVVKYVRIGVVDRLRGIRRA